MKSFLMALLLCMVFVASGCGGDDAVTQSRGTASATTTERGEDAEPRLVVGNFEEEGPFAAISVGGRGTRPEVNPPDRQPPTKILLRDLEVGDGAVARRRDLVVVHYVGVNYRTGKEQYGHWPPDEPTEIPLNFNTESKTWEESIEGMRVGGLREMIIPSRLLFDTGTIDYVLELVRVEPAGQ